MPRPETRSPSYARFATANDLDDLFRLTRGFSSVLGISVEDDARARALEMLVSVPALGRIIVTEERGSVSGYAAVTYGFDLLYGGRTAVMTELYVVPEWRGSGRGLALVALSRETARNAGARVLHLLDDGTSRDGRKLYEWMGAEKDTRNIYCIRLEQHTA